MILRALSACSLIASLVMVTSVVAAQARPGAALLQTTRSRGVEEGTAGAYERMVRQRLDGLEVVTVGGSIALDLAQLQLALGCMGDTGACLEAVSAEVGSPLILAPSLDVAGTELVASLLLFDARDGSQRRAVRRASGATGPAVILESVDGMLRELFGLAPAEELARETPEHAGGTGSGGAGAAGAGGNVDAGRSSSLSPLPFVLMGVGAAALIGGAVVGAIASDDGSAYRAARPSTSAQVDAALATLSRAQDEALAANILLIAGGVLAAGGVIWLLAAGNEDGSSPLAAAPVVGPGYAGVALAGTFGGAQ